MSMSVLVEESNYFKVKNKGEVRQVIESMGFVVYEVENGTKLNFVDTGEGTCFDENTEVVLSIKPRNNTNFVGTINENFGNTKEEVLEENNLTEEEVMIIPILEYFQEQLVEGYGLTITSASYESRRGCCNSPFGDVYVITKNTVEYFSTRKFVDEMHEKLKVEL